MKVVDLYPNTLNNNNNIIWISLNKLRAAHAWDKMALYNGEHDDNLFEWGVRNGQTIPHETQRKNNGSLNFFTTWKPSW